MMMSELHRWLLFWGNAGADGNPEEVYGMLSDRYSERHRAYHTLVHLTHCLDELVEARHLTEHPNEVEMALWFHDAIYDPKAEDNEERSAALALRIAKEAQLSEAFGKRVYDLVLATQHHRPPEGIDAQLLVDIDLSILGRPRDEFDQYETNIRKEYRFVPLHQYRSARTAILRRFLSRPAIYSTDFFQRKYESRARANLERSLGNLENTVS